MVSGTGSNPPDIVYFYLGTQVFAIRKGSYKAHFKTRPEYGDPTTTTHDPQFLHNLDIDPSEKYDIADDNPEIIAEIQEVLEEHLATVVPVENRLEKRSVSECPARDGSHYSEVYITSYPSPVKKFKLVLEKR